MSVKNYLFKLVALALLFPFYQMIAGGGKGGIDAVGNAGVFDITNYGISPNSDEDAVPALLKAAKAAKKYVKQTKMSAEIYIPSGSYNFSQFAFSNLDQVKIHLGENAILTAFPKNSSTDSSNAYITIKDCNDFLLFGDEGSRLDGSGDSWWSDRGERPNFILLEDLKNYELYGISITNSPNHTVALSSCKKGKIHHIVIDNPQNSPSTDGIDPMSNVSDLEIYECQILSGDDCIAINSNFGPMENIHIHDCILKNGHGLSFGSAINYDITNVLVENVSIEGTQYGLRIKCNESDRAPHLKNIRFNNIEAKNLTRDAIRITTEYGSKPNKKVTFQDIEISNFHCTNALRALHLTITDKKQFMNPLKLTNVTFSEMENKDIIKNCPIDRG